MNLFPFILALRRFVDEFIGRIAGIALAPVNSQGENHQCCDMELHELVVEVKLLERWLTLFEENYGVLSEDFHAALTAGKLARYDEFDETRADFSRWKGIYETWHRRKEAYDRQVKSRSVRESSDSSPLTDAAQTAQVAGGLRSVRGGDASASVLHSTARVWSDSPFTGICEGEVCCLTSPALGQLGAGEEAQATLFDQTPELPVGRGTNNTIPL